MAESNLLHRRAGAVLLFLGGGAVAALALAAGLRAYLPYDAFARGTPGERFLFWEGVVWMIGLLLVLFGAAGAMGTLHLIRWRLPSEDEFLAQIRRPDQRAPSLLPWWALTMGIALILIAVRARALLPG
jgi:hypothetical protein